MFEPVSQVEEQKALGHSEVHVWCVPLLLSAEEFLARRALLSTHEVERAGRFRFERDREAYIAARSALRRLLGAYLGAAPAEIEFVYGVKGKPVLTGDLAHLRFNVSHSGQLALLAFRLEGDIGVDLERVRPLPDAEGIVRRFFSAREVAAWLSLPEELRLRGFYDCWTRKEAYVKATGSGLTAPLDEFSVTLRPGEAAAIEFERDPGLQWSVMDVSPGAEYAAAVAIPGEWSDVRCWWFGERNEVTAGAV